MRKILVAGAVLIAFVGSVNASRKKSDGERPTFDAQRLMVEESVCGKHLQALLDPAAEFKKRCEGLEGAE